VLSSHPLTGEAHELRTLNSTHCDRYSETQPVHSPGMRCEKTLSRQVGEVVAVARPSCPKTHRSARLRDIDKDMSFETLYESLRGL
jgi:hypothetical protein